MRKLPLSPEQRLVYNAKQKVAAAAVREALRQGWLVRPNVCEECGAEAGRRRRSGSSTATSIEAAHYSYDEPLRVRWLCVKCHRAWDANRDATSDLRSLVPRKMTELLVRADRDMWGADEGYSLRALRRQQGASQAEISSIAGISQPTLSQIENGYSASSETLNAALSAVSTYRHYTGGADAQVPNPREDARKARQGKARKRD